MDSDLVNILKDNNLYEALYDILNDVNVTLEDLRNINASEFEQLCQELHLTIIQKAKFRTLMNKVQIPVCDEEDRDVQLQELLNQHQLIDLYPIFYAERIGFDKLASLTTNDIDKLCHDHNIKIGIKMDLKQVIEEHQRELLRQKYSNVTPGNPVYIEKEEEKDNGKYDQEMKLIIIGDSAVGKTKLLQRFISNRYDIDEYSSTVGIDCVVAKMKLGNGKIMKMNIFDTAGQERFISISRQYYRNADAVIVCYGVDSKLSFENCVKWRDAIERIRGKEGCGGHVSWMQSRCQTKQKRKRTYKTSEFKSIGDMARSEAWKQFDTQWCECSAATGRNVQSIFISVAHLVMERREHARSSEGQPNQQNIRLQQNVANNVRTHEDSKSDCC